MPVPNAHQPGEVITAAAINALAALANDTEEVAAAAETPAAAQAKADAAQAAAVAAAATDATTKANAAQTAATTAAAADATTKANAAQSAAVAAAASAATAAYLSRSDAAGTYDPIRKPVLYSPKGLRRWAAARSQWTNNLINIGLVGDSLTAGAYASTARDSTDTSHNQWRDWGSAGQVRARIATRFGYAGIGSSQFGSDEAAFALGGSPTGSGTIGPMQTGYRLAAGDSITIYTAPSTSVEIIYWWTTGAAAFTYTVDGGASVTAGTGSGTDNFFRETISGLSNVSHTIVISGPASGFAYLSQWVGKTASTGFLVHRMGKSGATTDTLAFAAAGVPSSTTNRNRMYASMFNRPGSPTDLAVIMLGFNDGNSQGTNGLTPTLYRGNLKTATDYISGVRGACTLLVAPPRSYNEFSPYTQQQFYDAAKDLALTDDHVGFIDMAEVFGTYADAAAVGYQWGVGIDAIHPTAAGHARMGEAIVETIFDKGLVNA